MRQKVDAAFTLAFVLCTGWAAFQGGSWLLAQLTGLPIPRGWGPKAGLFPLIIGTPVLLLAVAQLAVALRAARPGRPDLVASLLGLSDLDLAPAVLRERSATIVLTMAGFAAAIWLLGFQVAFPFVTFAYLRFAAREPWVLSIALGGAAGLGFYLFFVRLLGVLVPPGILFEALIG